MLSLRWPRLYKQLQSRGTVPVWLHARVMRLREESGEYEGDKQYDTGHRWHYADVLARVISLSRLTPQGPDQPLRTSRDVELHFEPFPNGLQSGVEFRVAARMATDGTMEPLTGSLEISDGVR